MGGSVAMEEQTKVDVREFQPGGYRFIKAEFQYSGGVAAMPSYRIRRVRFARPLPLASGFVRIEQVLQTAGRPLAAFCQCELRSPAPFTEQSFRAFNESYAGTLRRWAIFDGTTNPVARSNVCPAADPPPEPSFYAFSYTEAAADTASSFVISGSAEAPEGRANYRDHIVRLGDISAAGLREKARFVLGEMERRMGALGSPGAIPRLPKSIRFATSTHFSPMKSSSAAQPTPA